MKTVKFPYADGLKDVSVGQTVLYSSPYRYRDTKYEELQVRKIGRDLIHLSYPNSQNIFVSFYIKSGKEKTDYSGGHLYSSMAEVQRVIRETNVVNWVRSWFHSYSNQLSYNKAQRIMEILNEGETNESKKSNVSK